MGAMSTPLTITNNRKKEQMNYQTARERERERERDWGVEVVGCQSLSAQ